MWRRSRAREVALQVLFQEDLNPDHSLAAADRFIRRRLHHDPALVDFATGLIAGVRRHRPELDALLAARAAHWSLRRMAATDRNVLRLGAYEILHTDTPGRVAINEAVELARRFGTRQSGQFVNGLLDHLVSAAPRETTSE
ncbi:MAG: transcription antitermination factor NusB [Pirellulaceae bacterium]|jgi:N utilization substance protein B|nr:transcription antitermination factor NusB [Pirellulaceae bacterium]